MTIPAEQAETAAFLRGLAAAEPVETHISLVFLGTDTVWKLKKAVRLSFLDFTDLNARRHFCEREFALNAPAAPGLYRDVVPVVRRPDGSLACGGDGEVVDWILRMARVPASDFIDVMARDGVLDMVMLDQIADAVAAYHHALPPLLGTNAAMVAAMEGNTRAALEAGLPNHAVMAWDTAMRAALDGLAPWMAQRASDGFVRRTHGDLHLGNLCLWRGKPVPFDALEFDETLATTDLGYDLAFLLMDLEHRVDRAAANRVLNRYIARTGDVALVRGLPMFLSLRAMVRAHVSARMGQPDAARSYLESAGAYLRPAPVVVIAIGGLPGTGKSTLARQLAPDLGAAPGALILRSDEIRKRQFGVPPEDRLPPTGYSAEASRAVFATLAEGVGVAASGGCAVIADATFLNPAHRVMVSAAAQAAGVAFRGLWLQAPFSVLEQRVARRTADASDATVAVLRSAAANDPGPGDWTPVDATDMALALALARSVVATMSE